MTTTWTAPVRFAEVDSQGVVFNAHYLLYCDEAMSLFCDEQGLVDLSARVQVKASALVWTSSAVWGETITVRASCTNVGRTSFRMTFDVTADSRACCLVETTYVLTDGTGSAQPLSDNDRTHLQCSQQKGP